MLRISRTNMGPIGEWWFTVDRYMLFGIIFLGLSGLFFSLAVSPVEAGHLKASQYYFLIKQSIFFVFLLIFKNMSFTSFSFEASHS